MSSSVDLSGHMPAKEPLENSDFTAFTWCWWATQKWLLTIKLFGSQTQVLISLLPLDTQPLIAPPPHKKNAHSRILMGLHTSHHVVL